MPKTELKSLAHPDWPYAGTAHEWRGFVQRDKPEDRNALLDQRQAWIEFQAIWQKQNFGPELK